MHDVIVVGGGFAGVTAAREASLRGCSVLLLEARDRLGGRTWSTRWAGVPIELGGAWVHWHQPHTWSELTRAGLSVEVSEPAGAAAWYVDGERSSGTIEDRDAIAARGWNRFVDGVEEALPQPHDPLGSLDRLAGFDRLTIAERIDQLELSEAERDVLTAELESLAHAPLAHAGAVSVLRWHALSGYSLALTQFAGGRVTIVGGTAALLEAIASAAPFDRRLSAEVVAIESRDGGVRVRTEPGEEFQAATAIVAVPLNVLPRISFSPALPEAMRGAIACGHAARGIKLFIHAEGPPIRSNVIRPSHPFGYLSTDVVFEDGTQLLIGFGPDAERCDASDRRAVQTQLDQLLPGYEVLAATAHDWFKDDFARGTWAIHRPGWYEHHHGAMRAAHERIVFAGSDLADGWAGFIDGAIESGLRAGIRAAALSR